MTLIRHRVLHWLTGLFLALVLATPVLAQAPITFQYFYDELGQLTKVVDSAGNVIEYVYDPVGNILEIKRSTISGLSVFGFSPEHGAIGTTVMIRGQGFSGTPSDNTVAFKGVPTTVTSATTTTLVVTVPPGATTGGWREWWFSSPHGLQYRRRRNAQCFRESHERWQRRLTGTCAAGSLRTKVHR